MQGQRRTIDSYPDTIDFDPGSVANSTNMNHQTSWNNAFTPAENQLPNFMISSGEPDFTFGNAPGHDVRTFSGWGSDEPSSSANPPNRVIGGGSKTDVTWPSSYNVHDGAVQRLEERRRVPMNMLLFPRVNDDSNVNISTNERLHNSSSDCIPQCENQSDNGCDIDAGVSYNPGKSVGSETEHNSPASVSFRNAGSSSGISGSSLEENGAPALLGSWGTSCKRKSLEGASGSGHSFHGGSTSCFTQAENNVYQAVLARQSGSSSLSMSPPPGNSRRDSTTEQLNPRVGVDIEEAMDEFPPLCVSENSESPLRSFDRTMNSGPGQSPLPLNSSHVGSSRHINFAGTFQTPSSRSLPYTESLDPRSIAAGRTTSRSLSTIINESRISSSHLLRWNDTSFSTRPGSSSSSTNLSAERSLALRDDANLAGMTRNSSHANETRGPVQDPWNMTMGNAASLHGASTSAHAFTPPWPSWIPPPNPETPNHQRLLGFSPWTLFPSVDSEAGGQSGNFPPLSSSTSASSQENNQGHRQANPRSAYVLERRGDDIAGMPHSLRALAADIEGRHRLISEIRQVLSAMRRGENLRPEDYMFFDPLIFHGLPEINDRHRDMRLDVDNMSYEELLALGERIGDVKTGLSEEIILKLMKQRKLTFISTRNIIHMEPCCVCQEEYVGGDDLGTLECGHDFHTNCIKQWLTLKNLCPICKATGLIT